MAELQALLDRINEEGIKKAEVERQQRLEAAAAESARLIADAEATAAKLVAEAQREAEALLSKGQASLQQAARDVLLSLRKQLQQRLQLIVKADVKAAMSSSALATILQAAICEFIRSHGTSETLTALISAEQATALEKSVLAGLAADVGAQSELAPVAGLTGFKLEVKGADVQYDFSDAALAEALAAFLNPKLAAMLAETSGQ